MLSTEEKFKHVPSPEEANWVLVSMGNIPRILRYLSNFPTQKNGEECKENEYFVNTSTTQKACSSTLIWSGTLGNNTPIKLYGESPFGFILDPDPKKMELPHAEFFARRTGSTVPKEFLKNTLSAGTSHPYKPVRVDEFDNEQTLVTNYAKYDPISGEYNAIGSATVFAHSVWYKYHKKFPATENETGLAKIADLNEALVVGKKGENPINGIVIRAELFNNITDLEKKMLQNILTSNPNFKLLIYDPQLTEHIMREVIGLENKINFLSKVELTKDDLEQLQPFKGFSAEQATTSPHLRTSTNQFDFAEKMIRLENFFPSDRHNIFNFSKDETTKSINKDLIKACGTFQEATRDLSSHFPRLK